MASEVDISNLALAHLGDEATVASINPPEGSSQAEHCQRFYPIARDQILEMHNWRFSTKRIAPVLIASTVSEWTYSYALPDECLSVLAVLPPGATDDTSAPPLSYTDDWLTAPPTAASQYQTQPFVVESAADGTDLIYTNVPTPDVRYVRRVTDTSKFSPLVVVALSRLLASYLAGPVIKGEAGAAEAKNQFKLFLMAFAQAAMADANQRHTTAKQSVPWMSGR